MFKKLKKHWQVNSTSLVLIICTFALGGSLCGFAGRKILGFTGIEKGFWWILMYLLFITLLWPVCVLLISIPFGQFVFFKKYLVKIWSRMSGNKKTTASIAIFASGAGSNAQKIIEHSFYYGNAGAQNFKVNLIVSNKPLAGVLAIARQYNIETLLIEKEHFFRGDGYVEELKAHKIQFIVLAGFLWKIPPSIIKAFPQKIINIHPALLPKFGGNGMYGDKVHSAVIEAGEKESGITVHYVDELYDHGNIIFQASCPVNENDTAETLAQKIHTLEHRHYPEVIERLLQMQNSR